MALTGYAQILPVTVKYFTTVQNETKNLLKNGILFHRPSLLWMAHMVLISFYI